MNSLRGIQTAKQALVARVTVAAVATLLGAGYAAGGVAHAHPANVVRSSYFSAHPRPIRPIVCPGALLQGVSRTYAFSNPDQGNFTVIGAPPQGVGHIYAISGVVDPGCKFREPLNDFLAS
jgi:hypothetical protein